MVGLYERIRERHNCTIRLGETSNIHGSVKVEIYSNPEKIQS